MTAANHMKSLSSQFQNVTNSHSSHADTGGLDDDDDILQSIDLDQIVSDHYHSTCTPPSSTTLKYTPVNPADIQRHDDVRLPPEICGDCSHGFKYGICPEASNHLQTMKDRLISISNYLLDKIDLDSDNREKLHQDSYYSLSPFEK